MLTARFENLQRTVAVADWQEVRSDDPFVRAASVVQIGPDGIVRILDDAVLCARCLTTIGAYPPERTHPDNRVTGRGRWVQLLPVYTNHDGDAFYYPNASAPSRAHTAWHAAPDTPVEMKETLAAIITQHGLPATATVVPFGHFKVKCHCCNEINVVEVAA